MSYQHGDILFCDFCPHQLPALPSVCGSVDSLFRQRKENVMIDRVDQQLEDRLTA